MTGATRASEWICEACMDGQHLICRREGGYLDDEANDRRCGCHLTDHALDNRQGGDERSAE